MKRKKINKFLLILLSFVAILSIFYFYYKSLNPVFFVTDEQYYTTTIKKQQYDLKFLAFKNHEKLVIKQVEILDSPLQKIIGNDQNSLIIMSPLVSYFYVKSDRNIDNPYILIGYDAKDDNGLKAELDSSNNGWIKCAYQLKEKGYPLYLISDKSWPLSAERASVFSSIYGQEGITKIELNGDEMKQYALSLIMKIKEEGINNIVFTGSSLIGDFVSNDETLEYSVSEGLSSVVNYNQLNKVIYTDLSSLFDKEQREMKSIILDQDVWDFQVGLNNYLKQSWQFLVSKCF